MRHYKKRARAARGPERSYRLTYVRLLALGEIELQYAKRRKLRPGASPSTR